MASDNFNRANEIPLAGNWISPNANPVELISFQIRGSGGRCDEYWNPTTFGNDQYSQVRVKSVSAGAAYVYALIRIDSGGSDTFYMVRTDGTELLINKAVAGVFSTLLNCGVTVAVNDIIKISATGTTLRAYKNGTQVGQITDGSIASGRTGFSTFDTAELDDWEGGDFTLDALPFITTIGAKRI